MIGSGIGITQVACRGGAAAFSPLSLFSSGEEGAWYDPSDLSTLFQDAAGTTPVTADGQPVRLMLDKSKGLVLGSELATGANAAEDDTDATTGWDSLADVFESQSIVTNGSSFALHVNSNATATAAARMWRSIAGLTVGSVYRIEFDLRHVGTGGLWGAYIGNASSGSEITLKTVDSTNTTFQRVTATILISATTNFIVLREASAANTGGVYLDNLTIKELPGNHATAPSDAARPLYKTAGGLHWLEFDGVDDRLEVSLSALETAGRSLAVLAGAFRSAATDGSIVGSSNLSGIDRGLFLFSSAPAAVVKLTSNATFAVGSTGAVVVGERFVAGLLWDEPSKTISVRRNSVQTDDTAALGRQAIAAPLNIGGGSSATAAHYWRGGITQIVLYAAPMSSGNAQSSEAYIAEKSGVTLP